MNSDADKIQIFISSVYVDKDVDHAAGNLTELAN